MAGLLKSCDVKGGMIRVTCARCERTKYVEVSQGTRRKVVRCACGMSGSYKVNYRSAIREATSTRAQAVLSNARETVIRLCDTSVCGLGFTVPREYCHSFYRGQEVRIKFRGGSGSMAHRRIRVQNINGNRVGGKYS